MRILILFLLIAALLSAGTANAATIYGTVYDFSLKKVTNAEVEINSSPRQLMVAINGTYSFEIPNGVYAIESKQFQKNSIVSSAKENVTVKQQGNYVIDLILFPEIESGFEDSNPIGINESFLDASAQKKYSAVPLIASAFALFIIAMFVFYFFFIKNEKNKPAHSVNEPEKHPDDGELSRLISIIRHEGGRATQKEIRKQIPLSEAKISLMIAELEHKGVVEKIKKGRGNIIILKRR